MQTKLITYKRILNLGNYESKHLEQTVELLDGEDVDYATSQLMERVERKIREDISEKIEEEIGRLRKELRNLKNEYQAVKTALENLTPRQEADIDDISLEPETDIDDIPLEPGEAPKDLSTPNYF